MTTDTTDPVPVDPVHVGPETLWEPLLAATDAEALLGALDRSGWTFRHKAAPEELSALYDRAVARAHPTVTALLGDGGRMGEAQPPGWRLAAGGSAVWDG